MKQIILIPIVHRDEKRLLVKFTYDSELISIIKKVEGATFSNTHKSWHVPNNPEKLKEIFRVFKGFASIDTTAVFDKPHSPEKNQIIKSKLGDYNGNDAVLLKDAYEKVTKSQAANLNLEKKVETGMTSEVRIKKSELNNEEDIELPVNAGQKGRIVLMNIIDEKKIILHFPFAKAHVAKMKTIPYFFWHPEEKYWSFPYTPKIKSEIENYFAQFGFEIECTFRKSRIKEVREKKNYLNDRKVPEEYINMLKTKRYSSNTIDTYRKVFTDYINYFKTKELEEITDQEIKDYLLYLVEKRKISASLQNQVINGIKFYYEKVLKLDKLPYIYIDRPFKEQTLPTVLSEEEIQNIINSIDNLKHKTIILTLYSAGLRIGELLNLKMPDIDSKRNAVIIKGAKGKKDRYSLLSEKLLIYLRQYYQMYKLDIPHIVVHSFRSKLVHQS